MFASLISDALNPEYLIHNPWLLLLFTFQLWMFIDAIRREDGFGPFSSSSASGLSAVLYYFFVYRAAPSATRGFELPGAHDRRRIKELQAQIHHLDKAHHHSQLGDIYFQQGKLDQAEASYRAAMERDPQDIDTRAHLGQCLLRQKRAAEARPLLEGVMREKPDHDYGHTMMALAETLTALGETDAALQPWQQVTAKPFVSAGQGATGRTLPGQKPAGPGADGVEGRGGRRRTRPGLPAQARPHLDMAGKESAAPVEIIFIPKKPGTG